MGFQVFDIRRIDNENAAVSAISVPGSPTLFFGTSRDAVLLDITLVNNDTADHVISFLWNSPSYDVELVAIKVPAGQGADGTTPAISIYSQLPSTNGPFLMTAGNSIYFDTDSATSAGSFVVMIAVLGYF